jgi:hypothetical protein
MMSMSNIKITTKVIGCWLNQAARYSTPFISIYNNRVKAE